MSPNRHHRGPRRPLHGARRARSVRSAVLAAAACLALLPPAASAQLRFVQKGEYPEIDGPTQSAILDSACAVMDTMYVLRDVAARTVQQWRREFRRGAYRQLTDPVDFVDRLVADANAVYLNKHFGMRVLPPFDPEVDGRKEVDPRDSERARRAQRRGNYGFREVKILPGNIGYLRLDAFASTDLAAETAIGAMRFLGNCDALIFDLRGNGGGDASMIRLLTTYLFSEQQHLIDWHVRDLDETIQSWTLDYVPGARLVEAPVYVLTGSFTASAAEEFTFDLQHLKRGIVVGDTTAGAGHTVNSVFIRFENFRVGMRVPYGNAVDPRTGKGWEGKGVIPDICVPQEQALIAAQADALRRLQENATPEDSLAIAWSLAELESQIHPISLSREELAAYEGAYGPRRIFLQGDTLRYQREGRPQITLVALVKDLFRLEGVDYFRVRFDRDSGGRIVGLTGLYDDGTEEAHRRGE